MVKSDMSVKRILAKHLNELPEERREAFTENLCELKAPRGCNKIQREQLRGKQAKEIAEIIIRSFTTRYWKAKVMEALKLSNENQIRLNLQKALNADIKKKRTKNKAKAGGGEVNVADQKNVCAGNSSKPLKSQKSGEDVKSKIESDSMEESIVKAQTTGEAAGRKRKREEEKKEKVESKRTRKQPTRGKSRDEKHFITENRNKLINMITNMDPVLDDLLGMKLLMQEQYDSIRQINTDQNRMRELLNYERSWGPKALDKVLKILKKHNPIPIKTLLKLSKQKK